MKAFDYCIPTKIVFGEGTVSRLGDETKVYGKRAMLISYDRHLLEMIGIYETMMESLKAAGVEVIEYYGVKPNPSVAHVRACAVEAKAQGVEVLIAVGGGSVIDSTKFIAAAAKNEGDPWDYFSGKVTISDALPIVVVATVPATSSEMNSGAVLSNEEIKRKEGMYSPFFFPKVSILDPTVTYGMPAKITAYSMADAMSHLLEGYLTHEDESTPIQDGMMEVLMMTILSNTPQVLAEPRNGDARANLMWACALAWNGFPVAGVGGFGAPMHILGHSLSAWYDIAHGASLSIIMPHLMEHEVGRKNTKRIALFARQVMKVTDLDDEKAAHLGIEIFRSWLEEIGAPTSFAQAGLPTTDLAELIDDACKTAEAWGMPAWADKTRLAEVYRAAF